MMCVDCGREAEGLIGGSCAACFARTTRLMQAPEVIDLEICAGCRARHTGAHWYDVDPDAPDLWIREQAVLDAVGLHAEVEGPVMDVQERQQDARAFAYRVHMEGHVKDVAVEATEQTMLRQTKGMCDRCSRIAGGYYAAIIQLRATERDVTEDERTKAHALTAAELNRQLDAGNRFAFLAKDGEMHGGWDYYIGDIDAARNVARVLKERLGALVTETAKLVGRREGEDVHRVTFLVRIRRFSAGDLGVADGHPYLVVAVHPRSMQVLDLETRLRTRMHEDDMTRLGGREIIEHAVLVSTGPSGAQVMDPESYQTVDVLTDEVPVGETVPVVRVEERLYHVPERP